MASDAVRRHLGSTGSVTGSGSGNDTLRFVSVSLLEPPKKEYVEAITKGKTSTNTSTSTTLSRRAECITLNPSTGIASNHTVTFASYSSSSSSSSSEKDSHSHSMHSTTASVTASVDYPPGTQPLLTPDDCDLAESIVQSCGMVASALKDRYGIDDPSRVACDPWSVHLASDADRERLVNWRKTEHDSETETETESIPGRMVQTFLYHRQYGDGLQDNHYAHPIDIVPVVDLNARRVVAIDGMDRTPTPSVPTSSVQYHRDLLATNSYLETNWRGPSDANAALDIVQPNGPGFRVNGNAVEWSKWSFRVGFNHREGLVLHDVSYDGRPVLHRASLVEMAVPYADPRPPYHRKCAFDVGDYGLGFCANSLSLGCDCLGHIHYFDAALNDSDGNPYTIQNAVCMHEEDAGILWKHVEYRNGHNESRRSRELIVSSIATVVNYEYLFYWHFKQDGCIDFKIKLSGELSTNLLSSDEHANANNANNANAYTPTHGTMVAPGVNAQIHQHMFCARLDMAVDSHSSNTVSEVDLVSEPVDEITNPYGNAFRVEERILRDEQSAQRNCNSDTARCWKISSAAAKSNDNENENENENNENNNPFSGKPTAYKLIPFAFGPSQPTLLTAPSSAVSQKGAFATKHLWVTQHKDDERYPSGDFTVQGDGSDGLPKWTEANRNLEGEDVVVWHSFGVAHVPRSEDFPVMPCEVTGFTLKPDGFFHGNPGIDIEPSVNEASELTSGCCNSRD